MKRSYTQKEIYDYLDANPVNTKVHIGDLEDMNGEDYIFLDFLNDVAMLRDNNADYQTMIQISVTTKDYEKRKTLVQYIKNEFLSAPSFSKSQESEYYVAQFTIGVILTPEGDLSV